MFTISNRNLKIFFRDKPAVFLSLLAVFIIIGLYALFLGDTIRNYFKSIENVDLLINSWIMAGILSVTSITTTLGALETMVSDRSRKILKDFTVSPIKRYDLVGGYILSTFIIGLIMSIVTLIIGEIYIVYSGGELLSFYSTLKVLGIILLSVIASSSMMFFIVSFFKSQSAFTTGSTVVGTLIGFITGVCIPIGTLPEGVQYIIKIFPLSHSASLFRQVMLEEPMKLSFAGASNNIIEAFNLNMGNYYKFGDSKVSISTSIIILIATAIIFYMLAILNISRKTNK